MADGDRPIMLVPLATARKAARRAGVTLNLSAEDIALAGKWKHGWIPLDAVASAVKAKRYHGGATHEVSSHSGPIHVRNVRDDANNKNMAIATVVKDHRKGTASSHAPGKSVWVAKAQVRPLGPPSKGRAGSAVESRREPSRGRTKTRPPQGREDSITALHREHLASLGVKTDARDTPEHIARALNAAGAAPPSDSVFDARGRGAAIRDAQRNAANLSLGLTRAGRVESGPRREPHISAEPMKDGRHKLTDSKTGESVKAVHLASFHDQGHTITDVRNGQMHTRDDSGKAHVYDPATGRAARVRTGPRSKRTKPLNLPSGYEVRPDRVQVAPGVTQPGSSFSAYGPDGRRVHHAARSESEAARMARKHHERATESERRHQEAAAARSAAAQVKQGEQAAWDARMAAGTARHKVTTDAIAERRKAEPVLLRIRAGMLSKDDLTALADDPSAGRYERVAAHRALTALASRRLATATPAQLDQIESVAASARGLAPSERAAFMRAAAARRRKLKREGK